MTKIFKWIQVLLTIGGVGCLVVWIALGFIIDSGSLPRVPQPSTDHIVPFQNHGTMLYLTELQAWLHKWAIPGVFIFGSLAGLIDYIFRRRYLREWR